MKRIIFLAVIAFISLLTLASCARQSVKQAPPTPYPFTIQTFSGLELNNDFNHRDLLLGIQHNWQDDPNGVEFFTGLNVTRLGILIDGNYADPLTYFNDAPTTGEIYKFMQKYPQVKANGEAESPYLCNESIFIEELYVDQNDVTAELKRDFVEFCRNPEEIVTYDGLDAWWD